MPLTLAETPLYYKDSQGQYHRVLSGADMTGYRTAAAQDAIDAAQDEQIEAISHRNLLDNWYFVGGGSQQGYGTFPVNQREQTTYSGSGYCIDRWSRDLNNESAIELQAGGVKVTKSSSGSWVLQQPVNHKAISGKTVTFSALVSGASADGFVVGISTYNGSDFVNRYSASAAVGDISLLSVTMTARSDLTMARCVFAQNAAIGSSATIIAAKLEIGSTQTLAHQEGGVWVLNEVPDYATELAICQKYLFKLNAWHSMYCARAESDRYRFFIPHQMARNPQNTSLSVKFMLPSSGDNADVRGTYELLAESSGLYVQAPAAGTPYTAHQMCIAIITANAFISCE